MQKPKMQTIVHDNLRALSDGMVVVALIFASKGCNCPAFCPGRTPRTPNEEWTVGTASANQFLLLLLACPACIQSGTYFNTFSISIWYFQYLKYFQYLLQ